MRGVYRARTDVVPSEQALIILENSLTFSVQKLLLLANSGTHNLNPYHNTLHELQNVYCAWSCYVNQSAGDRSGPDAQELIKASLFHDHNHSGGVLTDDRNVMRAVEFAGREVGLKEPTLNIIRCTQFTDGKFPIEPTNLAECCIRDADLMTIYSQEGFRLMLGLFEEMAKKPFSSFKEKEVAESLARTEDFLAGQKMYTDHGNRMRDEQLVNQLVKFNAYVWKRFRYETEFSGRGKDE